MRTSLISVLVAIVTVVLGCGQATEQEPADPSSDSNGVNADPSDADATTGSENNATVIRHHGAWRITRMGGESVPDDDISGIVFRPDGAVLLLDNGGRKVALGAYIWDANVKPQRIQLVLEGTSSGTNFLANFTPKGELVFIEVEDPGQLIPSIDGQIAAGSSLESMRRTIVLERDDSLLQSKAVASPRFHTHALHQIYDNHTTVYFD